MDLSLVAHVVDLDAIDHMRMSQFYANATQQQGSRKEEERAVDYSHDLHVLTTFNILCFFQRHSRRIM